MGQCEYPGGSQSQRHAQAAVEDFVDELVNIAAGRCDALNVVLDDETRGRVAMAVCRILQTNALHLSPQFDNPCPTCGHEEVEPTQE